jgi:hypothetical protein
MDGDHTFTPWAPEATAGVGLRNEQLRCVTVSDLYADAFRRTRRQINGLATLKGPADIV